MPKFYLLTLSKDEIEIVDGQQRLNAIFEFFGNELASRRSPRKTSEYYGELPQKHADAFDDFEFGFDLIEEAVLCQQAEGKEEMEETAIRRLSAGSGNVPRTDSVQLRLRFNRIYSLAQRRTE